MPESPLESYLRSLGIQLPVADSFSAMRATLPPPGQAPTQSPPRMGPATISDEERGWDALQSFGSEVGQQPLMQVLNAISDIIDAGTRGNTSGDPNWSVAAMPDMPGAPRVSLPLGGIVYKNPITGRYALIDPSKERVWRALQEGERRGANWDLLDPRISAAAGNDPGFERRIRRAHAATMPNTDIVTSTAEASRATALNREGFPMSPFHLGQEGITMLDSKAPNLERAFADQRLSGPKIGPMGEYMLGEDIPVWDVHALDTVGVEAKKPNIKSELPGLRAMVYSGEGIGRGKKFTIQKLEDWDLVGRANQALADALQELAPGMSVNKAFAQMWEGTRGLKGEPNVGGWIDLLEQAGLLQPGAMLDPLQLREGSRILKTVRTGPRR